MPRFGAMPAVSPVHRGIGREHHTPLWRGYHGCKEGLQARWSEGRQARWREEARQKTRHEAREASLSSELGREEAGDMSPASFVSHRSLTGRIARATDR